MLLLLEENLRETFFGVANIRSEANKFSANQPKASEAFDCVQP